MPGNGRPLGRELDDLPGEHKVRVSDGIQVGVGQFLPAAFDPQLVGHAAERVTGLERVGFTAQCRRRGVLRSLREALFRGFDLDEEQRRQALKEPMCSDEWQHHVGVIARLRNVTYAEAEVQCREEYGPQAPALPTP